MGPVTEVKTRVEPTKKGRSGEEGKLVDVKQISRMREGQ